MSSLRVGTRGSKLALTQTDSVIAALREANPHLAIERVIIQTEGDRRRRASLLAIGGQGVFTRELELALLDGEIDVAVHSLKDLPSSLPSGLCLAATPPREDARDVLVTRDGTRLTDLPEGAVIGTGSLRRRAQLLALRPDLAMKDIRGNVDTRLEKLNRGEYDGIVLAAAGLQRLGWLAQLPAEFLPLDSLLPAPAQGILGLECRTDDLGTLAGVATISDAATFAAATAERAVLAGFGQGCRLPLAALALPNEHALTLRARVLNETGSTAFEVELVGPIVEAAALGQQAAQRLIAHGALTLLPELP